MDYEFPQPDKGCTECGQVIPANEFILNSDGSYKLDNEGHQIRSTVVRMICEDCAKDKLAHPPKRPRWKKGQVAQEQTSIEAPVIFIG